MPVWTRMASAQCRTPLGLSEVQIATMGQAKNRSESIPLKIDGQDRYML